ncbi:hypothetical protein KSF78_0000352 [Schistosoma japonicum]|nr:hypothetical protein KSF78_0000352 [Schistosoma japonicum]
MTKLLNSLKTLKILHLVFDSFITRTIHWRVSPLKRFVIYFSSS